MITKDPIHKEIFQEMLSLTLFTCKNESQYKCMDQWFPMSHYAARWNELCLPDDINRRARVLLFDHMHICLIV